MVSTLAKANLRFAANRLRALHVLFSIINVINIEIPRYTGKKGIKVHYFAGRPKTLNNTSPEVLESKRGN